MGRTVKVKNGIIATIVKKNNLTSGRVLLPKEWIDSEVVIVKKEDFEKLTIEKPKETPHVITKERTEAPIIKTANKPNICSYFSEPNGCKIQIEKKVYCEGSQVKCECD